MFNFGRKLKAALSKHFFGKILKYETISKYEISVQTYGSMLLCSIDEDDRSNQDAQLLVPQCPITEVSKIKEPW